MKSKACMIFILVNGVAAKHPIYMINSREKNIYFFKNMIFSPNFSPNFSDLKYNLNTKKSWWGLEIRGFVVTLLQTAGCLVVGGVREVEMRSQQKIFYNRSTNFVHYSEYLYLPPSLYATHIINPFLISRISAKHDKGLGF